uniref:AAA domain-containing protein n=1 Tax=Globodera pallida TaxID=36090 RepID=A0A183CCQ2_GLOPA
MVAQVAGKGVIAARVEMAEQWPDLVWVDNDSVRTSRPLEMGDGVKIAKVEWANTETGWAGPGDWLITSNKRLNHQAVAKEVSACSQGPLHSALGLVLHVERDKQRRGGRAGDMHVKSANIAAPQLPMVMRIQRRHMAPGMESTLRFHGLVQLKLATVIRPQSILVSPHYILPVGFPVKSGDEMLAHEPNLIVRVEPEIQKYEYPFDKTFSWKEVELGEKVMACALAAQRAYIQQEQNRFTLVVEILGVEELQENQVSLRFRHQLRNLQELMDMTEIWEEDTAVSCRADQNDATKPCAAGYVIRLEKRPAAIGYEVTAEVILGFQAAKGQNTWPQFEFLRDGALEAVELRPMISTRALRDRAEMLTGNVCSQRAQKGSESVGKIMSVLLGQEVVRDTPAQAGSVSLTGHKALAMLRGGQKDSAELMLDSEPRVVFQQAGPGTGKTFTAAAIMAAILKDIGDNYIFIGTIQRIEQKLDYARGATVGAVAGSVAGAGGLSGMVVGTVAGWTGGMIYNSAKNVVYYYYTQWSANQLAACIHATGGSKQSCCATTHFIKQCYDDVQEIEALFPISTHSKPLTEKVPSLRL